MVKSGRDTAYPFRLNLGGSMRRGSPRHRSELLKQSARKSACGMVAHIEEGGGKGKRGRNVPDCCAPGEARSGTANCRRLGSAALFSTVNNRIPSVYVRNATHSRPNILTAVSAIHYLRLGVTVRPLKQARKRGNLQHRIQCRQSEDPTVRIADDRAERIIDPRPADAT